MYVGNPKKTINKQKMKCGETAEVTLGFRGASELYVNSAEVVLALDTSAYVPAEAKTYIQAAANNFIKIMAEASHGGGGGTITNNSRMALVTFSDDAVIKVPLTHDTDLLRQAVSEITLGGTANHTAAFETAENILKVPAAKRSIVVMFTATGESAGGNPNLVAERLKADGREVYCIGLGTGLSILNTWASEKAKDHVAIAENPSQLEKAFRDIAAEVVVAVLDAKILEELDPEFEVTRIISASNGTATITDLHTVNWDMGDVGLTQQPETMSLTFEIVYKGQTDGIKSFNKNVIYNDRFNNVLNFPSPTVEVTGCTGTVIIPEPCPEPVSVTVDGCQDAVTINVPDVTFSSLGRIIQIDLTLKSICPQKRVAVSVILSEVDDMGNVFSRGVKHILVPAQMGETCQDITLKCIPFAVPEAIDPSGNTNICNARNFQAQVISNYIDTDFVCCN